MYSGNQEDGMKIIQEIWRKANPPKIYSEEEISESVDRVVREVIARGLIEYN